MRCSCLKILAESDSGVSPSITFTALWRMIGPESTSGTTKCTVHPETFTPCAKACSCAFSPGNEGRSAGWTFIILPLKASTNAGESSRMNPASSTRPDCRASPPSSSSVASSFLS